MNILRSNDVKRINKTIIRKALLDLRSATRKELMAATGISSSSIGSLIMEMVKDGDILEESIDSSTGGRCPMRYVLNYDRYRIMCMILNREFADLHILDSMGKEIYHQVFSFENRSVFMQEVKALCDKFQIRSINVSTPGIIQGDVVIQDSVDGLVELHDFEKLKEMCQLPLYIENDVKCMVEGYCADKNLQDDSVSYVYMSQEGGLGTASMSEGNIIRGVDHLAGEIGLLEYSNTSMNNLLRTHPDEAVRLRVLARLVSILVCCINPSVIILSGIRSSIEAELIKQVQAIVSQRFTLRFAFDEDNDYHVVKALWTRAMDELMHEDEENS